VDTPHYREKQLILPHPHTDETPQKKPQTPLKRTNDGKPIKIEDVVVPEIKTPAKIDMRNLERFGKQRKHKFSHRYLFYCVNFQQTPHVIEAIAAATRNIRHRRRPHIITVAVAAAQRTKTKASTARMANVIAKETKASIVTEIATETKKGTKTKKRTSIATIPRAAAAANHDTITMTDENPHIHPAARHVESRRPARPRINRRPP
jgi:hypothetical protein